MSFPDPILDTIGVPILAALFIFLLVMESFFGLRKRAQGRWKRLMINGGVSVLAFALLRLAFIPAVVWLASENEQWKFGLNYLYEFPAWIEFAIAFALLDYGNYLFHILLHKIPLLWRFHHVHHTDLDLDVSTAIRFHFVEIIASIIFRGAAVALTGATPLLVLVYEIAFEAAANFHHSNWCLPLGFERILNKIIVTPRMHGIHHSIVRRETDSNFSVIFSWWDRIHRTLRLNIRQDEIVIGTPAYRDPHELTIFNLLLMPFREKPRDWKLPDGSVPERAKEEKEDRLAE